MPFRYGKAVVTELPYAHVRADVEGVTGVSASALPPAWFDKSPGRTHQDDIRDLLRSLDTAIDVYAGLAADTAAGLHKAGEAETRRRLDRMNDLTAGFGVALLDAAVIDALCRKSGLAFHEGLRRDLFGLGPDFARLVPDKPLDRIFVRHTVGLADPIDGAPGIGDGLPETLEEVVRAYRVRYFKLKVSGDRDASLDRLRRIAGVLDREAGDYRVTIDGNEQFASTEEAEEFLALVPADLKRRMLWFEQPVDRSRPLVENARDVLLDESDGTDDVVDRALSLGYAGISAKNCKGVFRTLHSFARARRAGAILSSEDLMNIPVVPLHQDLCVAAALGIPHSERNGHHYVRAFEFLSAGEREAALREFPSLYRTDPAGLRVEGGALDLREINRRFFGVLSEPDWSALQEVRRIEY
jgi:hypothetical protein